MTMVEYESAWQHYSEVLKKQVEEDVLDFPPPGEQTTLANSEAIASPSETGPQKDTSEPVDTSTAHADEMYATPQQIAGLKRLAQQVGDDAYADVQDMLDHHPEGLVVGVYEIVKQRLKSRKAAKQEEAPAERRA
jgi:hypothetical protein